MCVHPTRAARLWDELLQCLTCDLEKVILKVKHKELHLLEKGKYVIQITINLCLRSSCKLFIQMQTQFKQHSIPYRLSLLSVFTELYLSERVGGGQTQHRHNATQRFHCAWVNKWVWEQYSPRPPKLLCISRRDLLQIMWTGDTESSPYRRQKRWKRGQREEKFCPPPHPWQERSSWPPAGFHGSVKVGAVVKPIFYPLALLISGLVRQPQGHISSRSSGGPKGL